MSDANGQNRLLGLEVSPYTMKVRAYFRFKNIPFEWLPRTRKNEKLFQAHAQVQLIPMVFLPDGTAMQDSTLIMEHIEAAHPEPSMYPEDPALNFISALMEEFGDEWCNKLMFLPRWFHEEDQFATAKRIASEMLSESWFGSVATPVMARLIVRRMRPRLSFAGASDTNRPHLEAGFKSLVTKLDAHLANRSYLLGGRPSFGDFGIWGNLYQAWTDPTAGGHIKETAPNLNTWIERMLVPGVESDFETLEALWPTLLPVLRDEVGDRFLKWSVTNDKAWKAGEPETSLEMNGAPYRQKTFKYHSFSLGELKRKFAPVKEIATLASLLEEAHCLDPFR